jgi:cobalt-zinc-cadmium efflux system outer membrane protein
MNRAVALIAVMMLLCGCIPRRITPSTTTADGILSRTGKIIRSRTSEPDALLPPDVHLDRPLSSDDAVGLALWNNPQLRSDLATLGVAEGDLLEAGLMRNPRLDLLIPVGAKPFELLLNLPIETFLQRPRRIDASQQALEQLAESLTQNGLNVARDARWAHADLVQAIGRLQIAKQAVDLRERIASLTDARLRAGDISELETIMVRTELGSTREQLLRFEHDIEIALERLRAVLGLAVERAPLRVASVSPSAQTPPSIEDLVEKAMSSRADLRAAELGIVAAMKRAHWERSRILWFAAQLSSKEVGSSGILTGPGVSFEIPVFSRNQGLIRRADAEVDVASRQYLALKQRVAFEVAEAREQLVQAQDAFKRLREEIVPPLERAVAVAENQYRTGDVAYLFVMEETRGLTDSQIRVIDAETAIRKAEAQLERCVGSR